MKNNHDKSIMHVISYTIKKCLYLFFLIHYVVVFAQQQDSLSIKNGIDNPSILATHHFGIFSSRINNNFKIHPSKNNTLTFSSASGNSFQPFMETYLPEDPQIRENLSQLPWNHRSFNFVNQETTPADYMNIIIDAVIKEFRVDLHLPLNTQHELGMTLRSYLITNGKYPFSIFTSDESIEWFHSNIYGGEDPYGRRYYGLNQMHFHYNDRNGNLLELNNNDFFIGGIEFNHFYYPSFLKNDKRRLYTNFGNHLGINTSKFNSSLDFGVSANVVKNIVLKNKNEFTIGVGSSLLRKNLINFKDVIDLGNNRHLASLQTHIEFTKYTKKMNYHAFGVNHHIQSRYNKLEETDYYVFRGKWKEINGGWFNGIYTLYTALSDWTFMYTYGGKLCKLTAYFKEDFKINNAPDFQTGLSLQIPLRP